MLFSLILPVYNVELYLKECIGSILKQTYTDYELILVDDGSTDGSGAICDEYAEKEKQIKVIHKANGGSSDARNAGIETAQGEYIIYLDSDDYIISDRFLEKLSEKAENKADLIFYKYSKYFDNTKKLEPCNFSYRRAMQATEYASKIRILVEDDAFYGMAWIKAIKRSLIVNNDIHFKVGLLGEDMEWNYHVLYHANSMEFIDEVFIAYRQRKGSVSVSLKIRNLTDFIFILEKWTNFIRTEKCAENLKIALYGSLAKYYSNLFIVYARLTDKEKKKYRERISQLDWLFKYSMSPRPQKISKIYKIFGFDITTIALCLLDKIKR